MLKSVVVIICFFTLFSSNETNRSSRKGFPESLYKIVGQWKLEGSNTYEIWEDRDSLFLGKVVKIENKDTILMEKLRILTMAGDIYFEATVMAQNEQRPILFKLLDSENRKFVFVNKKHDFPQQIVYDLQVKNVISATVSGNNKSINFKYHKKE